MNGGNRKMPRGMRVLVLCVLCLLINFAGARLATAMNWPLYLDSIGIVLASAASGIIPGIAVGFLSNIINGLRDYSTTFYSSISVLIAIAAAGFARRGWYKKPGGLALSTLILAAIGGGIGSVLTWFLYGSGIGEEISAPLAHRLLASGVLNEFTAELCADLVLDIPDKAITVLIAALTLRLLPEGLLEKVRFEGWRQNPKYVSARAARGQGFASRVSLRVKVPILLSFAAALIAVVVTGICYRLFQDSDIATQAQMARGVAHVVASALDADRVDEYLEQGEAAEGYADIVSSMRRLVDDAEEVASVYVYRVQEEGCRVVFGADAASRTGASPGALVPFDEALQPYRSSLLAGEAIDPVTTGGAAGWMLTVFEPICDSGGVCRCYAAVDISMEALAKHEHILLTRVISLFFAFFIMILAVGMWLAKYHIVLPINAMAMASGQFAYNSEAARADSLESIRGLDIHTGDEIENLYHAITATTEETVRYIADSQQKNETISKLQNGMIMVLADLVESRDQCTGNHVRNTAAYTRIIMEQMKKDGVYADQLTEDFIEDVVHSAPLHDVGKITVSDTLLNKPGRLNDTEYAQMKHHTTAGREIIDSAISSVAENDSGYLREARNLATYHHEKWDGTGYPNGLSGEQIPLSARIMAVADVFDALVARRSYKAGFPVDKAFDIIRQGSGTHFDPAVAGAFLRAEDQVRAVVAARQEREEADGR